MDVKDLKWIVYYHNMNRQEIQPFNVFNHYSFCEDVENHFKKYKDKDEFAEHLRMSLFYYYCSKAEWEIIISPWCGSRDTKDIKIDVYDQVMNNWDIFLDYVWNCKIHRPRKKKID